MLNFNFHLRFYLQGWNRDMGIENGYVDTAGEGEVC